MEGDGRSPVLLVKGRSSVHTFVLKPSQMQELANADIVFYMGDSFEMFLGKVLDALPTSIQRSTMDAAPGITLYRLRLNVGIEQHEEEDEYRHQHDESLYDLHLWLSPANAKAMAAEITAALSALYPDKAALYQANAEKLDARLDALDASLKLRMLPLAGKPFAVFHDAYQYFEKAYGLQIMGAVTTSPERAPGARHVSDMRRNIEKTGAQCVFREPEFDGRVVDNMLEGLPTRSGVLDPEGASLTPGPELYFQLMESIASGLEACLGS
jgi:zinc transport system substrate-binding protein